MLGPMRQWFDVSMIVGRGAAVVLAVVCYGLAGGANAWADTAPPASGSEAPAAQRAPESSPPAQADEGEKARTAAVKDGTSKQRVDPRGLGKRTVIRSQPEPGAAPGGAGPKWACDAQTVTMEPQWLGTPIKATWVVRNDGTSDMAIKVRGG
ncbi:MAG: hypothetical protein JSV19_10830 [Phycisphaerales bacterium]|nr:MAG: hypothetical protein JSV19_10830 [Phycisphaerales bacterium]